jgi:hypothetical protein
VEEVDNSKTEWKEEDKEILNDEECESCTV